MKKGLFLGLVFVLLVLPALPARAQSTPTSGQIPFSGTAPGQPEGPTVLTFNLFNTPDMGTGTFLGYSDSQTVQVTAEAFSAVLGAGTGGAVPAGTFAANPSVFIAIELISTPGVEIGPRVPLFSSGYAQFALTGGSGTITGVTAGSGLTGGGTSGTVTLGANFAGSGIANSVSRSDHTHPGGDITSPVATANNALNIADNTVTSAKIVDGSVNAVDVNAAQIQLRVSGICAAGNAIRVVNQDGTVVCQPTGGGGGIGGSGTANSIPKFTAATTLGDSAISEVGGNVGIGTTPGAKLHVNGNLRVESGFSHSSTGLFDVDAPFVAGGRFRILENGNVGIGTTAPTARLHVAGGNVNLDNSTATTGNILKGGARFIHNFGVNNTFIGSDAGNLTMAGSNNTASGASALSSNTEGTGNTANGFNALLNNTIGLSNTASGFDALRFNVRGRGNTASGVNALKFNTRGDSNTANGADALFNNSTDLSGVSGAKNTASGVSALFRNTTGSGNTASGHSALAFNIIGSNNTAIGFEADVSAGNLINATAIGAGAIVNANNKIRLGNAFVSVIEAQVGLTVVSDKSQKENFKPVDGEEVLKKIRGLSLTSWNFIGHDPKEFRHYGPMAQDFFAAFGNDGIGTIGTPTTITSTDMAGVLMIGVQTLERRTVEQREEIKRLTAENADLKTRLEALERMIGSFAMR